MAIRVQRHSNVIKQATLLEGLDVRPLKWRVCGCGLNRFVHEGMNHISNVEVHLKTRSGNVNIATCSGDVCRLIHAVTFANSLDTDRARQNVVKVKNVDTLPLQLAFV